MKYRFIRPDVHRFTGTFGPHAETERYTVNAVSSWVYHLSGVNIILYRPAAPSTSSYIQVRLKLYDGATLLNEFFRYITKIDTLDGSSQITVPLGMHITGSRSVKVFTADGSTGGSVEYIVHLYGYHFI